MIVRIIVLILLIILAILAYLLIVPVSFRLQGDFDDMTFSAYLNDPLRFVKLRFDTSREDRFSLRLFYFFRIGGKKKDDSKRRAGAGKKEDKKSAKKKGEKKNKLVSFIKSRLKTVISGVFSFLRKCHIHVSECDIRFSTGEPDTSALVYGGISSLPFMYGTKNRVEVDLMSDDAFISGHIKVSGSIFICILLYYVIKVMVTKGE